MSLLEQQNKAQKLLVQLTEKAWESPEFKEHLMNNPKEAIGELTGADMSFLKDRKIVVTDQTDGSVIYINLAAKPNLDDLELSEEELEMIAGGWVILGYIIGAGIGFGLAYLASGVDDRP